MIALDPRLATSFTAGLLAAVNPCGFVLLPTYLLYFLGIEQRRHDPARRSIGRAIAVAMSVSAGFMAVFLVIGGITKFSTNWFVDKSPWISLAVGVALTALGVAMLFGYRLPLTTPNLDLRGRDRSVPSMFGFGVAYAVCSIGCTIGPFVAVVLGGITADGLATGTAAIGLYGLGMSLLVTALTVTLAVANTTLLRVVRKGMKVIDDFAAAFVLLTGLYITWYWYTSLTDDLDDQIITRGGSVQTELSSFIERNQTEIVTAAVMVISVAAATALVLRQRPSTPPSTEVRRHEDVAG
jgi:cytochrome c-type biogenesis protein